MTPLVLSVAVSLAQPFTLPVVGCPMAHCDGRMSDLVGLPVPLTTGYVASDSHSSGARFGLGCSSNGTQFACLLAGAPSLVVYDADGHRLFADSQLSGASAWKSAPIIGDDGSVIGADDDFVLRVNFRTGQTVWKTPKPDRGSPISPVLLGSAGQFVLLATNAPRGGGLSEVSVYDVVTGALLSHAPLTGGTGLNYVTQNTPAVNGARAYVSTAAATDKADGRLIAVDVCEGGDCVRGALREVWSYPFRGPSGSSPLRIGRRVFFDGAARFGRGTFLGLDDLGDRPQLGWQRTFPAEFVASAAQDPRGGLWVYPFEQGVALRLSEDTGATVQSLTLSTTAGLPAGYSPASVISVATTATGGVALLMGIANLGSTMPTYVLALDVSSSPAGVLLWRHFVASQVSENATPGQFPIAVNAQGKRRIAFTGLTSGTFFLGEP